MSAIAKRVLILLAGFASIGCSAGPVLLGGPHIVEGTVAILHSSGGTAEFPFHPVYILNDCRWVQQGKKISAVLYINKQLNLSYVGKRVRIKGDVHLNSYFHYIIDINNLEIVE